MGWDLWTLGQMTLQIQACGALLGDGFACVVAAVVRGSFAHPARCHQCRTRHLACAWEEGLHVSWMQDFKNLSWLKLLLCLVSLLTLSIYCWWLLWVGTRVVGWKSWIYLASDWTVSLLGVGSSPVGSGEEGRAVALHPSGARLGWFHSALRTSSPEKWYSWAVPPPTTRKKRWKAMKHTIA